MTEAQNKVTDGMKSQNVTIDGTQYKAGKKFVGVEVGSGMLKGEYDVYLDSNGYMLKIEETEVTAGNYALVNATQGEGDFSDPRASLTFADGTKKIVKTAKDHSSSGKLANQIPANTIVSYREDDGVYTLKALKTDGKVGYVANEFAMASNKATVKLDSTTVTTNSASIFVVTGRNDKDITAYTGIKNAPEITSKAAPEQVDAFYYCKNGKMVTVMFITAAENIIKGTANKSIFFAKDSASNLISNSTGSYYNYNVVTNDGITTVKVDESLGKELSGLYSSYSVNSKGVIVGVASGADHGFAAFSTGADDEYLTGRGIDKTSKEYTVTLDTKNHKDDLNYVITVAKDAKIYYVDGDGVITESSYGGIMADANDDVYAYVDKYQVEKLFIEINSDGEPDADKVVIDAANYTVDYSTPSKVTVLAYKGADHSVLAGLNQVKAALAAGGYTKFNVTVAGNVYTITATSADGTVDFKWDSSTDYTKTGIKVKVDGKDYLVLPTAHIKGILAAGDFKGTNAKTTKADGTDAGYTGVTTGTLNDGYKYETGYVRVVKPSTVSNVSYKYDGKAVTADVFVKVNSNVTVEVAVDKAQASGTVSLTATGADSVVAPSDVAFTTGTDKTFTFTVKVAEVNVTAVTAAIA